MRYFIKFTGILAVTLAITCQTGQLDAQQQQAGEIPVAPSQPNTDSPENTTNPAVNDPTNTDPSEPSTDPTPEEGSPPTPANDFTPADPGPPEPPEESTTDTDPTEGEAASPPHAGDELVPVKPGFLMDVSVNRKDGQYTQGERLLIHFKSEKDAYVYVLYHQADGSSALIFPNKSQKSNLVKAKSATSIPAKGDGFRFRIAPPFGEEAIQVIASLQPIELLNKLNSQQSNAVIVPPETTQALAKEIKAKPSNFAEHRVVLHTYEGAGELPPAREPIRVGLFIGVNKLRDPRFGKEHEHVLGSAKVMHHELTTLGGIQQKNAKLIVGEQATRENFKQAVTTWLPSVTKPGDTVFLFYCGHGGQTQAIDDSEPDGLDEFFSVYDSDSKNMRETVVSDDALARWLQELPGRQIVLMMESCHSGGVIDGRGMANSMTEEAGRVRDISQLNTVVVTACLSDEYSSFNTKIKEATTMPLLWREAMRKLPQPITVNAAYRYYASKLPTSQEPNLVDNALLPIVLVPKKK